MILFADAAALVALAAREADWAEVAARVTPYARRLHSAMSAWETVAALCRNFRLSPAEARLRVRLILTTLESDVVPIGAREFELAADAYAKFGRGRHPAALNMGDCFAYACAKANGAHLLFKGEDFARTDIRAA